MILEKFGVGWITAFEERIQNILKLFPKASITNTYRRLGMLNVTFETLDNTEQYVLNCVSHKLERESVRVCERCGKFASIRKDPELLERLTLCWTCYALELSSRDEHSITETSTIIES
jgi:hypothetical protein